VIRGLQGSAFSPKLILKVDNSYLLLLRSTSKTLLSSIVSGLDMKAVLIKECNTGLVSWRFSNPRFACLSHNYRVVDRNRSS
jgi:hypothetical protein